MRIDPDIGFDNMMSSGRAIRGTTDWTQYEIILDLKPKQAQEIVFGALLVGNGTLWVDKLVLEIDGVVYE